MIRTTALAAFGTLALLAGQSGTVSAATYDPASAYVEQFTGAKVHLETVDHSITNPGQDYIDALHGTFRAQKRSGGDVLNYDASESYINRIN